MSGLIGVMDGLLAFDSRVQKARADAELRSRIRRIGTECGDCQKWMKSRECPREKHNDTAGVSRGPSCGSPVCSAFVLSDNAANHRDALIAELDKPKDPDHA